MLPYQAFIVKSSTRAADLVKTIAGRLKMKSYEGFSLFIKMGEKVISIPEGDFFFDFVRQITDWARKGRALPDGECPDDPWQCMPHPTFKQHGYMPLNNRCA